MRECKLNKLNLQTGSSAIIQSKWLWDPNLIFNNNPKRNPVQKKIKNLTFHEDFFN